MFGWLRRKKHFDGPITSAMIPALLDAYGALLSETASAIVTDISRLPTTKERIVTALKAAWLSSDDEEMRSAIEVSWAALASFQQGAGSVVFADPSLEIPPNAESMARLEAATLWMAKVNAEMGMRCAEIDDFKSQIASN